MEPIGPLSVSFNGHALVGTPLAGGQALYLPDFVKAIGLNVDALVEATSDAGLYLPRDDAAARYRGNPLPRSKCYVNATGSHDSIAAYKFPGWQWRAMLHYKDVLDPEVGFVQPLFKALRSEVKFSGQAHDFTQAIVTRYETGADNINWHSDKMGSIATDSVIFDVSLGGPRTFLLRSVASGAAVERVTMHSGSAIALTTAGNATHMHAVLPEAGAMPRVSIVFRNITTRMLRAKVEALVLRDTRARARRARREEPL
jgi:hypothetical protein